MKRTLSARRRLLGAFTAAVVALGLAACGSDSEDSGGEAATLTVDTSFVVKTLDPGQVYEPTGNVVVHALYSTLVTFDGSDVSKPVPDLAESYQASDDAKTFTFVLRKDAVFSDGSPVTSADVVFSLNRLKNLKGSAAAIVKNLSFTAKDEHTVVVTSSVADPSVPAMLTMPPTGILNSKVAKEHGGDDSADASTKDKLTDYLNTTTAGSGPYTIESFDASSRIVVVANPKYWGKKPAYSRVVFQNMDVQNQKLTISKLPTAEVAMDLSGSSLDGLPSQLQQTSSPNIYYQLRLHQDPAVSKVTSNPDYVAALRAAMDYQGIAALFGTGGQPAAGDIPTAFAGSLPQSEAQKQDLAKAKELLAKSGVGDTSVKLLYPALTFSGVDLGTIAAKVQADAAKAGIKIELDPAPIASFLDQRKGGKVAMSFSPQQFDYPVGASIVPDLMPGGGTAENAGWTAERADKSTVEAADKVLSTLDPDAQVKALQDWQRLMLQHSPYITLAYNSGVVVATPDLTNATFTAAGWTLDVADIGHK